MFGYLNLGNPKLIGNTEAQEAKNCRIDQGYLEYKRWSTSLAPSRSVNMGWLNGTVKCDGGYPFLYPSVLKWDRTGVTDDVLGIDLPATLPTVSAVAYVGTQPYPDGDYEYALTISASTGEESVPAPLTVTITTGTVATFANFPSYAAMYPKKTGLTWNVYRKPLGGSEYLLAFSIPASSATALWQDLTTDDSLGDICDSMDNGIIARTAGIAAIAEFSEKLFVAEYTSGLLKFSRTEKPWAFPTTFQFKFDGAFSGLYPLGEALVITFTNRKPAILYGNDESNYDVKDVDFNNGSSGSSGRVISGSLIATTMIDNDTWDKVANGVHVYNGAVPMNVSSKISNLFPRFVYAYLSGGVYMESNETETGTEDNRFYIFKLNATDLPWMIANNIPADPTAYQYVTLDTFLVVYDLYGKGFLMGDDTATFRYRTKEFAVPPKAGYLKRCFVESSGAVTVEVYLDGVLATTKDLNNTTKKQDDFYVKPWRADSFSFRFIGQPGAKVYSYGLSDPKIPVGG